MQLIETKALTSANASIVFSNIPQTFTDLYVLTSLRDTTGTVGWVTCDVRPNGTGSNISSRVLYGFGTTVGSLPANEIYHQATQGGNTANTFSSSSIYISNYAGSTHKSFSVDTSTEGNTATTINAINASLWSDTAAITSLTFLIAAGQTLAAGSTISLYGIGGAGDGYAAPKATGGIISYAAGYVVHTFTASGTFTPTANLTDVEYLVIAGGGGGGKNAGCGAGAGGYRSSVVGQNSGGGASAEARLSLTSGVNYTVTVGAGGAIGTGTNGADLQPGSDGFSSSFSTITSTGGGGSAPGGNIIGSSVLTRHTGRAGGSGGGSSAYAVDGTSGPVTGGSRTIDQGFSGGSATSSGDGIASAGGGGAGAVGESVTATAGQTRAGAGGAGVSSNITGNSIVRASGGSAWFTAAVAGGGGGTGQPNGIANTGGGAGDNGAGGSGIVIVRYVA